jgi:hypothetical protein
MAFTPSLTTARIGAGSHSSGATSQRPLRRRTGAVLVGCLTPLAPNGWRFASSTPRPVAFPYRAGRRLNSRFAQR